MRVAIFTDTFVPQVNGVARTVGRLAEALEARGITSIVLSPDTGLKSGHGYCIYFSPGFNFPFYPECKIAIPNYSDMRRRLDRFKPDLVHLVTEFSMGLCGLRYASMAGIPAVGSYHTNLPQYLSYYGFSFLSHWAWKYLRWFHNRCLINYCPSESSMRLLEGKGIKNLDIWGRGVDNTFFSPEKRRLSFRTRAEVARNGTLLLYVGRLAPEKELDILIGAYCILRKEYRDINLVITGGGPMAAKLMREAPSEVIFTGYLDGEELAAAYASSDIFVFPSTTETYGNVLLEAMSSGLPVVAPNSGGVMENLVHRYNGLACRPHSVGDMAEAVVLLKENPGLRRTLAEQARAHALTRSWDSVFDRLAEGYYGVVSESARKCSVKDDSPEKSFKHRLLEIPEKVK